MEKKEDLKKYFNPDEYVTKIIGKEDEEPTEAEDTKINDLIALITDREHKALKEQALITLKKEKGEQLLLLAIANPAAKEKRHQLVAACWESEINFSRYLSFFIILALDDDYLVSLEAITVISTMEGPFNRDHLIDGIKKIKTAKSGIASERAVLLNDLIITLEDLLRSFEQN
jgi:hypothetical protein